MTPFSTNPSRASRAADGPHTDDPFIIWTMRHGRSAALVAWLAQCGRPRPLAIDPFVPGSHWHSLPAIADKTVKAAELNEALAQVLAERPVIVHSVDDHDEAFQLALAGAATRAQYRHLLVYERNPQERLLNLVEFRQNQPVAATSPPAAGSTASPAGIDVPLLIAHARATHKRLAYVRHFLRIRSSPRRTEVYENLFDDRDTASARRTRWGEMFASMGIAPANSAQLDTWIAAAPRHDPLATRAPRLSPDEMQWLKRELSTLPGFEVQQCFLHPELKVHGDPRQRVRIFRLSGLPPFVDEGDMLAINGTAVPTAPPMEAGTGLSVETADVSRVVKWPLPSPALASQLPAEPLAGQSRFRAAELPARSDEPWRFMIRTGADDPAEIATLRFVPEPKHLMRGVFLAGWSIGYQPVPLAASTAVKQALFLLATGYPFSDATSGGAATIHQYFEQRSADVSGAWFRFTVVRNPIDRFVANYEACVVRARELSLEALCLGRPPKAAVRLGKLADPSLEAFAANFDAYLKFPSVARRFRPLASCLAPLGAFDAIYRIEDLDKLGRDMRERVNRPFDLSSSPPATGAQPIELTPKLRQRIATLCARDLDFLSAHYPESGTPADPVAKTPARAGKANPSAPQK